MVDKKLIVEKLDSLIECLEKKCDFAAIDYNGEKFEALFYFDGNEDINLTTHVVTRLSKNLKDSGEGYLFHSYDNAIKYQRIMDKLLDMPGYNTTGNLSDKDKTKCRELERELANLINLDKAKYIPNPGAQLKNFSAADDTYILYSYTIDPNNKVEYPRTIVHAGLEDTCHKLREQKEKNPDRSDFKYKVVKLSTFIKKFGDRGWQKYKFYKGILNKNFSAEDEWYVRLSCSKNGMCDPKTVRYVGPLTEEKAHELVNDFKSKYKSRREYGWTQHYGATNNPVKRFGDIRGLISESQARDQLQKELDEYLKFKNKR